MKRRVHAFIYQNSNVYKIRLFFIGLLFALIIVAAIIAFREILWGAAKYNRVIQSLVNLTHFEATVLTPADLFFAGLIGGLFFVLMPLEFLFYSSVKAGSSAPLSTFMMVAGYMAVQAVNYYIGHKFHPIVMNFVSKKKIYETRRVINKYGGYGVFFLNLSPLPSEVLTFALGITRYNVYRLFTLQFLANVIKYSTIAVIASLW